MEYRRHAANKEAISRPHTREALFVSLGELLDLNADVTTAIIRGDTVEVGDVASERRGNEATAH